MDLTRFFTSVPIAIVTSAAMGPLVLVCCLWLLGHDPLGSLVAGAEWLPTRTRKRTVVAGAEKCQMLIAGDGMAVSTVRNKLSPLESRALPNQRLVHVFGIDNAFTTSTQTRLDEFKGIAKAVINLSPDDWLNISTKAQTLVSQAVQTASGDSIHKVQLETMVQGITLKISLDVLFKVDALTLDNQAIITAAKEINRLWAVSKTPKTFAQRIQGLWTDDQHHLQAALRHLLPHRSFALSFAARDNPMNLILPAYETLWRVVLAGFVEINFPHGRSQSAAQAPSWRRAVKLLLDDPSTALDKLPSAHGTGITAFHVAKENLRLYPSAKRINRRIHLQDNWFSEDCAADIEAIQRDKAVWGADAEEFDPSRWTPAKFNDRKDEKKKAYMPFGRSPFICPAQVKFGPKMAALLVAALSDGVPGDWKLYAETNQDILYEPGALPSGREFFKHWYISNTKF